MTAFPISGSPSWRRRAWVCPSRSRAMLRWETAGLSSITAMRAPPPCSKSPDLRLRRGRRRRIIAGRASVAAKTTEKAPAPCASQRPANAGEDDVDVPFTSSVGLGHPRSLAGEPAGLAGRLSAVGYGPAGLRDVPQCHDRGHGDRGYG